MRFRNISLLAFFVTHAAADASNVGPSIPGIAQASGKVPVAAGNGDVAAPDSTPALLDRGITLDDIFPSKDTGSSDMKCCPTGTHFNGKECVFSGTLICPGGTRFVFSRSYFYDRLFQRRSRPKSPLLSLLPKQNSAL